MKKLFFIVFLFWGLISSKQAVAQCEEKLGPMPSITFKGSLTFRLTNAQQALLAATVTRLKANPNCRIIIVGYCTQGKVATTTGAARGESVRRYFVENQGISNDRITLLLSQSGGDCNTVDLRAE